MDEKVMFLWGQRGPYVGARGGRVAVGDGRTLILPDRIPDYIGAKFTAEIYTVLGERAGDAKCETC
jgi:hypothetical protein